MKHDIEADRKRHAGKIETYTLAVVRVGFERVKNAVGGVAVNALELAADAQRRQQDATTVANFLATAQGTVNDPDYGIYDILKSLKAPSAA